MLLGISTLRSRKTFSGKLGIIFSATHLRASTGSLPQIVGHGDRISTKVNPAPARCSSSALRTARRAFMMFLLSESATRSMYTGALSEERRVGKEGRCVGVTGQDGTQGSEGV